MPLTFNEIWLQTLTRSFIIAVITSPIAIALCRILRAQTIQPAARWRQWFAWSLLLGPLIMPALLCGYYYRTFAAFEWVHQPLRGEWLYRAVLVAHFAPLATLILYFAPPPAAHASARHAAKLAGSTALRVRLTLSRTRAPIIAFAAVFFFAFVDYEFAWLFDRKTWTIKLFEAQQFRQSFLDSVLMARLALLTQLIVVGGALVLFCTRSKNLTHARDDVAPAHALVRIIAWLYLSIAFVAIVLVPLQSIAHEARAGWGQLSWRWNESFVSNLRDGALLALAAALIAHVVARIMARKTPWPVALAACLPGLLGAMMLSMLVIAALQWPISNFLYDRPEPMVLAMSLLLLPAAALLSWLHGEKIPRQADHAMRLLAAGKPAAARRIRWQLHGSATVWSIALLFVFAFFEFTATSLLHPSSMTPSSVSAYNNMHYGQSDVLSARVLSNCIVVVAVILAVFAIARLIAMMLPMRACRIGTTNHRG